ncbi:MAG: DUF2007 domain-containing protein [Thiohalomonadaceae bacterium]
MILVYAAPTMFMVAHVRNLLEAEGIDCHVRNEFLSAGAGELPPTEVWPEVWVVDDTQAERARQLIAEATRDGGTGPMDTWQCPVCGEHVDGNFGQCWKCGGVRVDG